MDDQQLNPAQTPQTPGTEAPAAGGQQAPASYNNNNNNAAPGTPGTQGFGAPGAPGTQGFAAPGTPGYGAPGVPPVQPQGPKKKRTGLIVGLVILALVIIGGGWAVYHHFSASEGEASAYAILDGNDNPDDYRAYLRDYPDGPHAAEVQQRLAKLEDMLADWGRIALSDNKADFVNFKNTYDNPRYGRMCDIKIDSLDFVQAQRLGTDEAYAAYLAAHPDGRYASEAAVAQGTLKDQAITEDDRAQVMQVITAFYDGFSARDADAVCSNITPTMTQFLSQRNVGKAQVMATIEKMYGEHITGCQFTVNRDLTLQRLPGQGGQPGGYKATFSVDQHIERDDAGKTFGSYQCQAQLTPQLLISSLTMKEVSKN